MSGIWFLFTAREPVRSAEVVIACVENDGAYPVIVRDEEQIGIGPLMDREFERNPDLDFYGWLADDTFPETQDWNKALEEAAGRDCVSYADDGGYQSVESLEDGTAMSSGLCFGGDLVRAAGSWSLGFHSAWLDVAWLDLIRPLQRHRYLPGVKVRHDHWRTNRRAIDDLDYQSHLRIEQDRQKFHDWQEHDRRLLLQRLEAVCVS